MPEIDVTDILAGSYIAGEPFWVLRRREVVNNFGEVTLAPSWHEASGSIMPVGNNSLLREESFQTQAKTLQVISTFRLQGEVENGQRQRHQPDLVYWGGDYFLVRMIKDWSRYGAGMIEAECSSINYTDHAPPPLDGAMAGAMVFSNSANSGLMGVLPCC